MFVDVAHPVDASREGLGLHNETCGSSNERSGAIAEGRTLTFSGVRAVVYSDPRDFRHRRGYALIRRNPLEAPVDSHCRRGFFLSGYRVIWWPHVWGQRVPGCKRWSAPARRCGSRVTPHP